MIFSRTTTNWPLLFPASHLILNRSLRGNDGAGDLSRASCTPLVASDPTTTTTTTGGATNNYDFDTCGHPESADAPCWAPRRRRHGGMNTNDEIDSGHRERAIAWAATLVVESGRAGPAAMASTRDDKTLENDCASAERRKSGRPGRRNKCPREKVTPPPPPPPGGRSLLAAVCVASSECGRV
jgi:hypothetical protein